MSPLNDTDTFLVNRSNKSYQIKTEDLSTKVADTDLLLVNRSNQSYKITGKDFIESLISPPVTPAIVAPLDGAGIDDPDTAVELSETVYIPVTTDEITGVSDTTITSPYRLCNVNPNPNPKLDGEKIPGQFSIDPFPNNWAYGNGMYIQLTAAGTYQDYIYSYGGVNWEHKNVSTFEKPANSIRFDKVTECFYANVNLNENDCNIYKSANGLDWELHAALSGYALGCLDISDSGVFYALDRRGYLSNVYVSNDSGLTWQLAVDLSTKGWIDSPAGQYALVWSEGEIIVVGFANQATAVAIANESDISPAGWTFTRLPDYVGTYNGAIYHDGVYLISSRTSQASGAAATILWSEDMTNWNPCNPLNSSISSVQFIDGYFVASPNLVENTLLISSDGKIWTTKTGVPSNTDVRTRVILHGDDKMVVMPEFYNSSTKTPYWTYTVDNRDVSGHTLTFKSDKGLNAIQQYDYVEQDDLAAEGTAHSITSASSQMVVRTYTGAWSANTGNVIQTGYLIGTNSALKIYSTGYSGPPLHYSSDWQITRDSDTDFANPVDEASSSITALTEWSPKNLKGETIYRCRVRHNSAQVSSEWSPSSRFKTAVGSKGNIALPGEAWVVGSTPRSGTLHRVTVPGGVKVVNVVHSNIGLFVIGADAKVYTTTNYPVAPLTDSGYTWDLDNPNFVIFTNRMEHVQWDPESTQVKHGVLGEHKIDIDLSSVVRPGAGVRKVNTFANYAMAIAVDTLGGVSIYNRAYGDSKTLIDVNTINWHDVGLHTAGNTDAVGLDDEGTLHDLRCNQVWGDPIANITVSYVGVNPTYSATKFTDLDYSVVTGGANEFAVAALTEDGQVWVVKTSDRLAVSSEVHPPVVFEEFSFWGYNLFARTADNRVFVAGDNTDDTPPTKYPLAGPWVGGVAPTKNTWGELELPAGYKFDLINRDQYLQMGMVLQTV